MPSGPVRDESAARHHILLGRLGDDSHLSAAVRAALENGENIVFVSAVALDITSEHAHAVAELPDHHRDPFDRMLIAQAASEKLTLVTADSRFESYGVPLIKN